LAADRTRVKKSRVAGAVAHVLGFASVTVGSVDSPSREQLARMIDHTLLRPDATRDEIRGLCEEARTHGFAAACVNPIWVPLCAAELSGGSTRVCTVVDFPLGASKTSTKVEAARRATDDGADELDMVMAIGLLRSGEDTAVGDDIAAVVNAVQGRTVKVILETALLTADEIDRACVLAKDAGARFVKTSTGFGPAGASFDVVARMRAAVGPTMGVKASGGIRDAARARQMIAAGADRLGTSSAVAILAGWKELS
jgi:deoxyribose-phosphate aldolase